jgi:hypothetical protein
MNSTHIQVGQVGNALRARAADFFMMDVPRATATKPAHDRNPLRRPLSRSQGVESWESNENMCAALWELMARG